MQEFLVSAKPDLQKARQDWLTALAKQRRLSAETVEAYERDSRQFLQFMTGHNGGPPALADIAALRPADLRPTSRAGAPYVPRLSCARPS